MKGIVFDLDGTLIDSAGDLQAAANRMLAELSRPPLDRETVIGFIGRGVEVLVRRVLDHSGVAASEAEFAERLESFRAHYAADLTTLTTLYPGVADLLSRLRGRGIPMAVCTNKPAAPARSVCAALNLDAYFAAVVGGDTLPVKKPDPAPLLHAIDLLGATPDEALYIGDSETDYLTSRAAGVRFVYFEGGYQRRTIPDFAPDHSVPAMGDIAGIVGV